MGKEQLLILVKHTDTPHPPVASTLRTLAPARASRFPRSRVQSACSTTQPEATEVSPAAPHTHTLQDSLLRAAGSPDLPPTSVDFRRPRWPSGHISHQDKDIREGPVRHSGNHYGLTALSRPIPYLCDGMVTMS